MQLQSGFHHNSPKGFSLQKQDLPPVATLDGLSGPMPYQPMPGDTKPTPTIHFVYIDFSYHTINYTHLTLSVPYAKGYSTIHTKPMPVSYLHLYFSSVSIPMYIVHNAYETQSNHLQLELKYLDYDDFG